MPDPADRPSPPGAAADLSARCLARARVDVRTARDGGPDRLRLRFAELDAATQAAVLGLDPIADRGEYAELVALVEEARGAELAPLVDVAVRRPGSEPLAQRARNLGLAGWRIWAGADPGSLVEELRDGDWFGEIALRTHRPRTATVTALP